MTIREGRKALGLTQKQLAERVGFERNAVGKWERGLRAPDSTTLAAMAVMFGCEPADIQIDAKRRRDWSPSHPRKVLPVSREDRNAVVLQYLPMVDETVRVFCMRYRIPQSIRDDLRQSVYLDLLRVVELYDPIKGASLKTYIKKSVWYRSLKYVERDQRRGFVHIPAGAAVKVLSLDDLVENGFDTEG